MEFCCFAAQIRRGKRFNQRFPKNFLHTSLLHHGCFSKLCKDSGILALFHNILWFAILPSIFCRSLRHLSTVFSDTRDIFRQKSPISTDLSTSTDMSYDTQSIYFLHEPLAIFHLRLSRLVNTTSCAYRLCHPLFLVAFLMFPLCHLLLLLSCA